MLIVLALVPVLSLLLPGTGAGLAMGIGVLIGAPAALLAGGQLRRKIESPAGAIGSLIALALFFALATGSFSQALGRLLPIPSSPVALGWVVASLALSFYATVLQEEDAEERRSRLFALSLIGGLCAGAVRLCMFVLPLSWTERGLRDYFALCTLLPKLGDATTRLYAVQAMGLQGEAAIETLAQLTKAPTPEVRAAAVESLGQIALDEATPHVLAAATDQSAEVRAAVIRSMRHATDHDKRRILESSAQSHDLAVQIAVLEHIPTLKLDRRQITTSPSLRRVLESLFPENEERSQLFVHALIMIGQSNNGNLPSLLDWICWRAPPWMLRVCLRGLVAHRGNLGFAKRELAELKLERAREQPAGLLWIQRFFELKHQAKILVLRCCLKLK